MYILTNKTSNDVGLGSVMLTTSEPYEVLILNDSMLQAYADGVIGIEPPPSLGSGGGGFPTSSFAIPGPLAPWGSNTVVSQYGTGISTASFGSWPLGAFTSTNLYYDGTTLRYINDGQGQLTVHWAGTQQFFYVSPGLAGQDAGPNMTLAFAISQSGQVNADKFVKNSNSFELGYLGVPQGAEANADTLLDKGMVGLAVVHSELDTTPRTYTLDSWANQNWEDGATILIENMFGAGAITITSLDTLQLVGAAGSTGPRTLASGGRAELRWRLSGQTWRISGSPELT